LVATSRAAATVTLSGGNEWDVAAGVLLIEESGGTVTDASGKGFRFNQADPRLHGTIASGPHADSSLIELIRSLGASLH
jgi:myo-inositol-1(or 4)-monophosphatase